MTFSRQQPKLGQIVKSIAGKDLNNYFVIIKIEGNYVWLSAGRGFVKKKNIKHIQVTSNIYEKVNSDLDIREALAKYAAKELRLCPKKI